MVIDSCSDLLCRNNKRTTKNLLCIVLRDSYGPCRRRTVPSSLCLLVFCSRWKPGRKEGHGERERLCIFHTPQRAGFVYVAVWIERRLFCARSSCCVFQTAQLPHAGPPRRNSQRFCARCCILVSDVTSNVSGEHGKQGAVGDRAGNQRRALVEAAAPGQKGGVRCDGRQSRGGGAESIARWKYRCCRGCPST